MCIVYRAAPSHVTNEIVVSGLFPERGFGRRVPLALGPMLAHEADREPMRRAARDMDWGSYLPSQADARVTAHGMLDRMVSGLPPEREPLALAAVWGGPPAQVDAAGRAR